MLLKIIWCLGYTGHSVENYKHIDEFRTTGEGGEDLNDYDQGEDAFDQDSYDQQQDQGNQNKIKNFFFKRYFWRILQ